MDVVVAITPCLIPPLVVCMSGILMTCSHGPLPRSSYVITIKLTLYLSLFNNIITSQLQPCFMKRKVSTFIGCYVNWDIIERHHENNVTSYNVIVI